MSIALARETMPIMSSKTSGISLLKQSSLLKGGWPISIGRTKALKPLALQAVSTRMRCAMVVKRVGSRGSCIPMSFAGAVHRTCRHVGQVAIPGCLNHVVMQALQNACLPLHGTRTGVFIGKMQIGQSSCSIGSRPRASKYILVGRAIFAC